MSTVSLTLRQFVERALKTPSLTQGYTSEPVEGVVEALDGWTVSVGLAFVHDKVNRHLVRDIVRQQLSSVDFVVESVEIGNDVSSLLVTALGFHDRMKNLEPIAGSDQEVHILARAPRRVETNYRDLKDLFGTRRIFGHVFVFPSSFAFFINRFAILRQPRLPYHTKLDVLMQLFLYWCVMESSYHLGPQHQHSEKEWSELIAKHRNHEVYGEASFVAMRDWWFGHVEGKDGPLGQSIALRTLGSRPAREKQHELEDSFRSMVTSLTKFFDNVSKWLNHSTSQHPPSDTTFASSSNGGQLSSSRFEAVARSHGGRGGRRHADDLDTPPVGLDY